MLKYVNTGIVFQEIPDEVTLAINISGCPCRCPGCHSQFLWGDIGEPLTEDALTNFIDEYGDDMTCIAFMGGDAEPERVGELARFLHHAFPKYKVAWYSGRIRIPKEVKKTDFDYIKVGPYLRHLGSLREPTTNQRLYRRMADNTFEDITSRFWK
ncbi:MAG: anaerobic ribonucleoside-triphosphate reductase activating protein [Prevotella sp.]|nr:anaerobic ribonucleoside-triphosphate reductase activating protein [Prevotella sp.]